ncbi:hypothetical protein ACLOJK_036806 [Asimina triloba]
MPADRLLLPIRKIGCHLIVGSDEDRAAEIGSRLPICQIFGRCCHGLVMENIRFKLPSLDLLKERDVVANGHDFEGPPCCHRLPVKILGGKLLVVIRSRWLLIPGAVKDEEMLTNAAT